MQSKDLYRIAVQGLGLTLSLFLIVSCLTFDIADSPSPYVSPNNTVINNLCGPVGAFLAYYLMYYVGPGIFLMVGVSAIYCVVRLLDREVSQLFLRVVGLLLMVSVVSAGVNLVMPSSSESLFPMGRGGILGIAVAELLKRYFGDFGTFIVMMFSFIVGSILVADSMVLAFIRGVGYGFSKMFGGVGPAISTAKNTGQNMSEIWKRLNARQKQEQSKSIFSPNLLNKSNKTENMPLEGVGNDEGNGGQEVVTHEDEGMEEVGSELKSTGVQKMLPFKIKKRKEKKIAPYVQETYDNYLLPPLELLEEPEHNYGSIQEQMVKDKALILEELLSQFNLNAHVVNAEPGPAITMYELELAAGIKVSQITSLSNDIARGLGAQCVRVVAPLPGRHTIGIEVPNSQREIVRMKDLIVRAGQKPRKMRIPLFLGKDSSGEVLVSDLASMPHALIAGTTGSGKSVCINTIITSILMTRLPDEVKLILIDPKMVEMVQFDSIPHLMCPIVTEMKRAEQILEWAVTKMDERYSILAEARVRNIASYNELSPEELVERFSPANEEEEAKIPKKMPHMVIIVDELADLMMTSAKEVESYIVRIAQKSRAVGIHIILATQRPQATVVTGLIKSNLPARISFRVASRMDSRIILDYNGAETLLGQGDMLFLKPGTSDLVRAQGAYLDDDEIRKVVKHLKEIAEPQYHPELMQLNRIDTSGLSKDDLFDDAVRIVLETKRGSVSLLQRKLGIGYSRASRIIELMAVSGILGEYKGSQAREVLFTLDEWEATQREMAMQAVTGFGDGESDDYDTSYDDSDDYEDYDGENDED